MALTLSPSFSSVTDLVLPLAQNSSGLSVRVVSLGTGTLGTLTALNPVATPAWQLVDAPGFVTMNISPNSLVATLNFSGATFQPTPYEFYVSCTDGVTTVYFPFFLEVKQPLVLAYLGGGTTISLQSYDSTIPDSIIQGLGLGNVVQSGVNFILPGSMPTGLEFVTSDENQLVLRGSDPSFANLAGGIQIYTSSPVSVPLTIQGYQVGSFYDTPDRAYSLNLTIESLTQKLGTVDLAVGSYVDPVTSYLHLDGLVHYLQGRASAPLTYTYTITPGAGTYNVVGGSLTGTVPSNGVIPTLEVTATATTTFAVVLTITFGINTVGQVILPAIPAAVVGSWTATTSAKIKLDADTKQACTGDVVPFTLTADGSGVEDFLVSFAVVKGSALEGTLTPPSSIHLNSGNSWTAPVSVTFPTGAIGEKWTIQASAVSGGRSGFAEVIYMTNGLPPLAVALTGGNSIATNTGALMTPVTLAATNNDPASPSFGNPVTGVTFELYGAPDGVYINNAGQIAGNNLKPGIYTFLVSASKTGYTRGYSSTVTLTVTALALPLAITNPTSSVSQSPDGAQFIINWSIVGGTNDPSFTLDLEQQPTGIVRNVAGSVSWALSQTGTNIYSVYGTSFYGTSYSVPVIVVSSSIETLQPLRPAPAVGTIDSTNFLVLNWNPLSVNGGYGIYKDWNITLATPPTATPVIQLLNGSKPTGLEFSGSSPDSRIFQEQLTTGDYGINMQAESSDLTIALNSPYWDNQHTFPSPLVAAQVSLDNATLLLGQTVTVTLLNTYPGTIAGATGWQVIWPDNTSTGALPLSSRSVAKSFSVPGAFNIIVETIMDFSNATPPVKLYRSLAIPIFVMDQQFNPQAAAQSSLTGTLGFGGPEGFEIVDATTTVATPQPYSVVARAMVRDTITNELKLLVLTSRFSNASSELGTMALDVFPVEGRPHAKELIVPSNILTVTSATSAIPVRITTTTLPNAIVGKTMTQFKMQASGGLPPYEWANDDTLPPGLQMSVDGTISGIPTALGTFNTNFAVIDSSSPAFIAETTLPFTIQTDLSINTVSIPNATVLTPYNVQLISSGGLPPYTWEIAAGALPIGITIDPNTGALSGVPCTYNSVGINPSQPGDFSTPFSATIQITDAIGAKASKVYTIHLFPAALQFGPIDQPRIFCQQDFILGVPIFGGQSPYSNLLYTDDGTSVPPATHTLQDGRAEIKLDIPTTAVGVRAFTLNITDSTSFTLPNPTSFNFTAGQRISDVRMQNAFFAHYWSNTVKITAIAINGSNVLSVTANNVLSVGQSVLLNGLTTATFLNGQTVVVTSLIGPGPIYTGFTANFTHATYTLASDTGTAIDVEEVTIAILGNLSGFTLNPVTLSPFNGLSADINPVVPDAEVTGPATTFRNAELRFPLQIYQGTNQVAQISRPYTLDTHDDSAAPGEVGTIATYTRPYIVGDFVGLNPRKPYWNSPDGTVIPSFTPTPSAIALTVRVQAASSLPTGLSLDANTGLIYGYLLAPASSSSVLEYVDSSGLVHGTVTVNWLTLGSDFQLINNGGLDDLQTGTTYTVNAFTAPTGVTLSTATLFAGNLPTGFSVSTDGTHVVVSGLATEAGYFDAWFRVTAGPRNSYVHYRISVDYIIPLVILTTSLPAISAQAYSTNLQGFGGIPPYASWTSPQFQGVGWTPTHGIGTGNFAGLSLITNVDGTGTISGTLTSPPGTSPTDLGNISLTLTDTRGVNSAATSVLDLVYNNTLRILTPTNGIATIPADTSAYSFAMQATGGVPFAGGFYKWQMTAGTLPTGIVFDATSPTPPAEEPAGGKFSGATSVVGYNQTVSITVTDSAANTASGIFTVKTGTPVLTIDQSGIGPIPRGQTYQGRLVVDGPYVTPINWQVSPTATDPNFLPAGLSLAADASTLGVQAVISGTYSGPALVGYLVRVVAVDNSGQSAAALVSLSTVANSVVVTTTSLPNATVGGSYSYQLTASGGVPPYVWGSSPTFPFNGLSLSSSGLITGSATILFSQLFNFTATDTLLNSSVATPLTLTSQAAGLAITTTQAQLNLNQPVGGRAYIFTFAAGGDPNTPYTWSISPASANQLPTGLALNPITGAVSGTTILVGFSKPITLRVTDNIGAFAEATFTFTVGQGLALQTGIDYEDSTATNILGYIDAGSPDSINPRPNLSFYVVATGVISTLPSQLAVTVGNPNVAAVVESIISGVALIKLDGIGFASGIVGSNNLTISVTDSGVNANATFTWTVYNDGVLRLAPSSGNLPTQLAL
jgi:hypothetical protein